MRISSMVSIGGYIGGMLLEKFYNRGWVDYVLLVLTPYRAARLDAATRRLCHGVQVPDTRTTGTATRATVESGSDATVRSVSARNGRFLGTRKLKTTMSVVGTELPIRDVKISVSIGG